MIKRKYEIDMKNYCGFYYREKVQEGLHAATATLNPPLVVLCHQKVTLVMDTGTVKANK